MENCFVNQFKGITNNDSLVKFNCVRIKVYPRTDNLLASFRIQAPVGTKLFIEDDADGYFTDSEGTQTQTPKLHVISNGADYESIYCHPGDYYVFIDNKYNIEKLTGRMNNSESSPKFIGINLGEFDYCTNLSVLTPNGMNYSSGSIDSLTRLTKLENIILGTASYSNDKISGSINTMVEGMIANGRTSGTITGRCYSTSSKVNIQVEGAYVGGGQWTVTITSATQYSVATRDRGTFNYQKVDGEWVLVENANS